MNFSFGKRESQLLKGIAVILMFMHHFWGFPNWRSPECSFTYHYIADKCIEAALASFGKVCVGIYAFISGYALLHQVLKKTGSISICKKALRFLGHYWFVFLIFLFFGALFHEPFAPPILFVQQLFGINTGICITGVPLEAIHPVFAWYVSFYVLFLFLSPQLAKLCKHGFLWDMIIISIVLFGSSLFVGFLPLPPSLTFIKTQFSAFSTYGQIGMTGFLFAKYDVFQLIHNTISKYLDKKLLFAVSVLMLPMLLLLWTSFDIVHLYNGHNITITYMSIYVPLFIYCSINILNFINCNELCSLLYRLSVAGPTMWYLHGLFFTPNKSIQWLAYLPKNSLLILLWALLLTYICSVFVDLLEHSVFSLISKKFLATCARITKKAERNHV